MRSQRLCDMENFTQVCVCLYMCVNTQFRCEGFVCVACQQKRLTCQHLGGRRLTHYDVINVLRRESQDAYGSTGNCSIVTNGNTQESPSNQSTEQKSAGR